MTCPISTQPWDSTWLSTIVWSGTGAGDLRGVFLRRFDAAGTPIGDEELVNTETRFDQEDASVSVTRSGAAVVSWTSQYEDGSHRGVYVQEYDSNGNQVGRPINVNQTSLLDQRFSSVAVRGESAYTVVWSGRGATDASGAMAATFVRDVISAPEPFAGAGAPTQGASFSRLRQDPVSRKRQPKDANNWINDSFNRRLSAVAGIIVDDTASSSPRDESAASAVDDGLLELLAVGQFRQLKADDALNS